MQNEITVFLLSIGFILLVSLTLEFIGRHTNLPRVTLLLIFGIVIGKEGIDLIPEILTQNFEIITDIALLMIGFLLGGKITITSIREHGVRIISISVCAVLGTALFVLLALWLAGIPLYIAILIGCLATATDPAATMDTIVESQQNNTFTKILYAVVALDDAWALILFSLGLAFVSASHGMTHESNFILHALRDIGGGILLGCLLGVPAAKLSGRIRPGQPMLIEALGLVFLCGGFALWFEVSYLISAMVMGTAIANFAEHHEYPFHAIEDIEVPFLIIFFVLAGASLEITALQGIGLVTIAYIVSRIIGKYAGVFVGGKLTRTPPEINQWMGIALLPQAGVALGMALIAANAFPEFRQTLLSVVISTTVLFELAGPVFTRLAINKVRSTQG